MLTKAEWCCSDSMVVHLTRELLSWGIGLISINVHQPGRRLSPVPVSSRGTAGQLDDLSPGHSDGSGGWFLTPLESSNDFSARVVGKLCPSQCWDDSRVALLVAACLNGKGNINTHRGKESRETVRKV